MKKSSLLLKTICYCLLFPFALFFMKCALPSDPDNPSNTTLSLILEASDFQKSDTSVTDTVGETIRIGLCLGVRKYIDSINVTIGSSEKIDSVIELGKDDLKKDTIYCPVIFSTAGTRTVTAIAYVGGDFRKETAKIHIIVRPVPNRKPELAITGKKEIVAGQVCTLIVSVEDPDSGQSYGIDSTTFPEDSRLVDSLFTWQTTVSYIGMDTIIFIAWDNGSPPLADTEIVVITVNTREVNNPPYWSIDTIVQDGIVGQPVYISLADKYSDPDDDSLTITLLDGKPDGDTIFNDTFAFTPTLDSTYYSFVIVADSIGASDTLVLKLNVLPADTIPPVLHLISPDDSSAISASSCQIKITATDESGILSFVCFKDNDSFSVTRTDSIFTATITGLVHNTFSTFVFIATDSFFFANSCTLLVTVKYDSTLLDVEGPIIMQNAGPLNNSRLTYASDTIRYTITDNSGTDSVWWALNGIFVDEFNVSDSDEYQLIFTLLEFGTNSITIYATDRSVNRNVDSFTLVLDYNTVPSAIIQSGPIDESDGVDTLPTFSWTGGNDKDDDTTFFEVHYGESTDDLSNKSDVTVQKSIKLSLEQKLLPLSIYYWQVIGWSNTYPDTIESVISSFTTLDPTAEDNTGPVIVQESGPLTGTRITLEQCTISVIVTDPNGVGSVTAALNDDEEEILSGNGNDVYTFTCVLSEFGQNTITFRATDNSANQNIDSLVVSLMLNRPPVISIDGIEDNGTIFVSEGQTLSFIVEVSDPDPSDAPFLLSPLNAPYSESSNGTGNFDTTTGEFTFTPAYTVSSQSRNDTIKNVVFYATDYHDFSCIDSFSINIVIENTNRPPYLKDQLTPITKVALLGLEVIDTIDVIDPDNDLLTFSQITSFSRSDFSFNPNTGILRYTADTIAQFCLEFIFSDGLLSDTVTYIVDMQNNAWVLPSDSTPITDNGFVQILAKDHCFMMGSNNGDTDEQPPHYVCFTYDFWAGQTEVNQEEYSEVMGANPSTIVGNNYPVHKVSWKNAIRYCIRKSEEDGFENCYDTTNNDWTCDFTKNGYRLPTEAEWEYACRGGTTTEFFTGSAIDANYAVFNSDSIQPIKTTSANPYHLYDISGNAGEWCYDRHDLNYYSVSPHIDPIGSENTDYYYRVERGGTYLSTTTFDLRSAGRTGHGVNSYYSDNGFRVFRTIENEK